MRLCELDLNWASRDNAERPGNFNDSAYTVRLCNVSDVFKHVSSDTALELDSDTGGKNAIGDRLSRAKQHFTAGEAMDFPEVAFNQYTNNIDFTNGRHRAVAAYQLGHEYIPMFIYRETLAKFESLVRTKPYK